MKNKSKIIGTGLSGLVGSRIVELLSNSFDFTDFSVSTNIDILNFRQLEDAFLANSEADTVIHLAAFTDTNAAWNQRGDKGGLCYDLNVNGTRNIVDLCQKYKKYLIYISTDFVFDGKKEGLYTEEDLPHPIEWYGETKFLGEKLISQSGLPSSIVRIAYPYRSSFEPKKDLIRKVIDGFKAEKLYPMFDDQITTPTFIDDIANGLDYFFTNKPQGIFHLVGSSSQTPYQMCLQVARTFGFDEDLVKKGSLAEYVKTLPPDSRPWQINGAISNQKIQSLGIKMKTLKEGLEELKLQSI